MWTGTSLEFAGRNIFEKNKERKRLKIGKSNGSSINILLVGFNPSKYERITWGPDSLSIRRFKCTIYGGHCQKQNSSRLFVWKQGTPFYLMVSLINFSIGPSKVQCPFLSIIHNTTPLVQFFLYCSRKNQCSIDFPDFSITTPISIDFLIFA